MKIKTFVSILLIASTMFARANDKTVTLDEAPRTIQKAIKEHAGAGKIMRIEKATEQRQVHYEALIKRAPSGSEIEDIEGAVAEFRHQQPLAGEVDGHVIDPPGNPGERDIAFEREGYL